MTLRATEERPDAEGYLFGREPAMRLVREFADRPRHDGRAQSRPLPVLLFTGPRGSGKTAFLAALQQRLDQQVPYARIDCDELGSIRDTLAAIVYELNRNGSGHDRIAFPRFITGQIVAEQDLDTDPALARLQAEHALAEHRSSDKLLNFLAELAPDPSTDRTAAGHHVPDLLRRGLMSWRRGRRVVLTEGQDWFAHQDRGLARNSLDVLVELNRWAREPGSADSASEAGELLWAAFLADLRENFDHGNRGARRPLNCLVLLDNVDSPAAKMLLDGLVQARRQHAAHVPDGADPLTVVATSRGKRSGAVIASGESAPMRELDAFDLTRDEPYYADYAEQGHKPWYPIRLRDLVLDEIANMVDELGRYAGNQKRRVSETVFRFTHGHPGATRHVLDEIQVRSTDPIDLRDLLHPPEIAAAQQDPAVAAYGPAAPLLAGIPKEVLNDLITCSAARTQDEAERLVASSGLVNARGGRSVFAPELWVTGDDGVNNVLPPVLRRLLLQELAARAPEDTAADWMEVHTWLSHDRVRQDDEVGEFHHALAAGELESVALRLSSLLNSTDPATWLDILARITAAPNRLDHDESQLDLVRSLANWTKPGSAPFAPVARLVAALWIAADPLGDGRRHSLYLEIAACFDEIAPFADSGLATLRAESEKYRRWSELTD
ncbi:AAA family ATPase [Saccharopolyspora sp. NPDC002578]